MPPDIRALLRVPLVYRLWVLLIGQKRDLYINDFVQPKPGQRILDIGCGPGDVLEYLPHVEYVGIDHNPEYIESARERFGSRGTFKCLDASEVIVAEPNSYDIVMANGLLHHLDDEEAEKLLSIARQALKPSGYLVTFDGCFTAHQSPIKRLLLRMDRGKFVRKEDEYLRLARKSFGTVASFIREDFYNPLVFPYTIIVMKAYASKLATSSDTSLTVMSANSGANSRTHAECSTRA